nr:hypothetical protein GCM10025730_11560 [Promicromonospora thailandica]
MRSVSTRVARPVVSVMSSCIEEGLPCVAVERTQANPPRWDDPVGVSVSVPVDVRTPEGMKGWSP